MYLSTFASVLGWRLRVRVIMGHLCLGALCHFLFICPLLLTLIFRTS